MSETGHGAPRWWERILGIGPHTGYRWPGIVRAIVILGCLVGLLVGGYFQAEHLILRAQLRRINRRMAVLQERLDQHERLLSLFNDSSLTRLTDSLRAIVPDTLRR
jgi:hypothetical protein